MGARLSQTQASIFQRKENYSRSFSPSLGFLSWSQTPIHNLLNIFCLEVTLLPFLLSFSNYFISYSQPHYSSLPTPTPPWDPFSFPTYFTDSSFKKANLLSPIDQPSSYSHITKYLPFNSNSTSSHCFPSNSSLFHFSPTNNHYLFKFFLIVVFPSYFSCSHKMVDL